MKRDAVCLTPWDSQGNQVWDAVNDTVFTTVRGCGGAGYQQSYILARNNIRSGSHGCSSAEPATIGLLVFDGQGCSYNYDTAYTLQASRVDDHHISVVCYERQG